MIELLDRNLSAIDEIVRFARIDAEEGGNSIIAVDAPDKILRETLTRRTGIDFEHGELLIAMLLYFEIVSRVIKPKRAS
jgi:hypothetical protein